MSPATSSNRQRLEHLADAGHPGPAPTGQAEGDVRAQLEGRFRRPAAPVSPAQRKTAAASADPPPNPAPAGMRLTSRTCALRPTSARARGRGWNRPSGTSPWPPGRRSTSVSTSRPSPAEK